MPRARAKAEIDLDGRKFEQGVEGAKRSLRTMEGRLASTKRRIIATFSGAAVLALGRNLLSLAGRMGDLSEQARLSTDAFQALLAVGRDMSIDEQPLTTALTKIHTSQQRALAGNKDLRKAFADLGIEVNQLALLVGDELVDQLARAYSQTEDFNALLKLTSEENGPRLARVLKEIGEDGLAAIIKLKLETFDIIPKPAIRGLDRAGDSVASLGRRASGVAGKLAAFFLPEDGPNRPTVYERIADTVARISDDDRDREAQIARQLQLLERSRKETEATEASVKRTIDATKGTRFGPLRRIGANLLRASAWQLAGRRIAEMFDALEQTTTTAAAAEPPLWERVRPDFPEKSRPAGYRLQPMDLSASVTEPIVSQLEHSESSMVRNNRITEASIDKLDATAKRQLAVLGNIAEQQKTMSGARF